MPPARRLRMSGIMSIYRLALVALLTVGPSAIAGGQPPPPAALEKGFEALQNGETDKAAAILREALTLHPRDAQLLFGAGVVAKYRGQDQDAIAFLKQALQIEPQFAQAAAYLGELVYRQGDVDLAIKMYERALPHAPASVSALMRQRLEAWRGEASLPQNHTAMKDDRFTISFDGLVQQKLAARATSVLTAAFWRIGKTLGAYPSAPINVVLYSERQFHDITGAPEWAAGGFDGVIRMPVRGAAQNLAEFDRVLTHELTHAMLRSVAPRNLPAWLDEGLAMHCEGRDGALSERRLAAARLFVPLATLQTSFSSLSAAQAAIAYEESAFAAYALLNRIGTSGLGQLLQDLSGGQTMEQAIERFGVRFAAFESDLERRVGVTSRAAGNR
jgi:tetratricopeptide (TPR) repeat protein